MIMMKERDITNVDKMFAVMALLVPVLILNINTTFAQEAETKGTTTVMTNNALPIHIEEHFLQGQGLTVMDPGEASDEGVTTEDPINSSMHLFFAGNISAYVFQVDPGRVRIDGLPYDEYVHILEGRLILTPDEGEEMIFETGDHFIVPEGYTGYWTMPEPYREFVIINTIEQ